MNALKKQNKEKPIKYNSFIVSIEVHMLRAIIVNQNVQNFWKKNVKPVSLGQYLTRLGCGVMVVVALNYDSINLLSVIRISLSTVHEYWVERRKLVAAYLLQFNALASSFNNSPRVRIKCYQKFMDAFKMFYRFRIIVYNHVVKYRKRK